MSSLTPGEIAYCAAVLVFSYSLRGSSGFGSAMGMPLLALVIPLKVLVPAWTLLGIASSIAILGHDRKEVAYRALASVAPWCAMGVAIGLYFFTTLDAQVLARALGVLIIAYAAHSFLLTVRPPTERRAPRFLRPLAGVLSGAVGTTFGTMASVFFAMHLAESGLAKRAYRATMSAMLLTLSIARGIGYAALGEIGSDALVVFVFTLPAMALGIFVGDRIHERINDAGFRQLVCLALLLSGIALILN